MERHDAEKLLSEAARLEKCLRCGCLKWTLEEVADRETESRNELVRKAENWLDEMEEVEYDCLGCDRCYPAEAAELLEK